MMNESFSVMLWVDDDGCDRYIHEEIMLNNKGWRIDWAFDVEGAVKKLAEKSYRAVFLDQMLPYIKSDLPQQKDENIPNQWGGCAVLRWLRKADLPKGTGLGELYEALNRYGPHSKNELLPVLVVSAYYDNEIRNNMRSASEHDNTLKFEPKPIVIDALFDFLEMANKR